MAKTKQPQPTGPGLKALFLIADWDRVPVIAEILDEACPLSFVSKGSGTASSEVLDLLGLGATDKGVFFCVAQSTEIERLLQAVRLAPGVSSAGAGIAFTVPLSGVNVLLMQMFTTIQNEKNVSIQKKEA
ncbi:MAG: hypothetical protein LBQ83_00195 [Candidatus Margulisbacteria bacterium]|jgi:hypothetical protein|nr:hypothetical protein [Candidatus Margulisiibacteriota bacterium]